MEFPRKPYAPIDPKKDVLEFQITDLYIPEADKNKEKDDDELYSILIYGTCMNGSTVCVNVDKFVPYFYVKPPESWENLADDSFAAKVEDFKGNMMNGTYRCRFNTQEYDRRIIPRRLEHHFDDLTIVRKKDFWGFTNNKIFRFMKVSVKSQQLFNSLKYYFKAIEKEGFKLYESNIDPFLKYIHIQGIKPCGWVRIENKKYTIADDISRCDYNIQARYDRIQPIDVNQIAPLIITSFDIECSSSHGDFPVAIKNYSKVAQDLALVVKAGYEYDEEYLVNWLQNIFLTDIIVDQDTDLKINRVYSKRKITSDFIASIPKLVEPILKDMTAILDKIASSVSRAQDTEGVECVEEEEDDETKGKKNMTVREMNEEEDKLAKLLDKVLPSLEGDKIIQIGTTVHRYGSDDIIYKNIITLDTCNDIEGCDVVPCRTEKELLTKWKELMNNLNSDIITGYNIFGFDMEYIWNRAKETGIIDEFAIGLGRLITRKCTLVEQKLSSSALGDNILMYLDMDGMVLIDLLKVMQREQKLDSYKLDNVASIFLGDKKNDLKPQEIFEKFRGSAEDRCTIAKYCIQDCCLVNRLVHKLKILENNIGMGNVCLVPLNYLFRRGQGIKIFSLIAKQCMDRDSLIPTIKSYRENVEDDTDGYEGAVVLEPKEGIYLNEPVVVFDYGSLYPSSMIARNLSHDTYVLDKKYMILDDPNVDYMKVCHDIYEGVGDKKKKTGVKECIFAQYKDGRKGIIPEILNMLLQERKNTRKKIEYQTAILKDGSQVFGNAVEKGDVVEYHNIDTGVKTAINKSDIVSVKDTYSRFEQDVFDSLQLAYKITANSLYGQIGARTSSIYLKDIAASTTATGREMIMLAKDFVEKNYNAEVIYGDSVMPYTPITYLLNDSEIVVDTFENIQGEWAEYSQFKPQDTDRFYKEQLACPNMKVWTHKGWAQVRRIIRHKTTKKIYRVLTHTGLIDVTEDHSLLDKNCEIIKPSACVVGQELLHSQPELHFNKHQYDNVKEAYVYGVFVGDGSCGVYNTKYGIKYSWAINNTDLNLLSTCKDILEKTENMTFKILNTMHSSNVYKLVPSCNGYNSIKYLTLKYREHCYLNNAKIIPKHIINCDSMDVLEEFRKGLFDTDGNRKEFNKMGCLRIDTKNQITAQSYCILLQKLGYNTSINTRADKLNIYRITYTKNTPRKNVEAIKKIDVLHEAYYGYVYDIETEQGVFHAGVGNMILKNTDSIFCKFPLKDGEGNAVYGKDSLKYAIEIGQHVETNIVQIMPKPQKLNYEKCLYPFILFSKKRYVGNLYETDVKKFKQKSMGIVLKRRDNAPIVKKIYGGVIDIILNKQDLRSSIEFLQEELNDLVAGKAPIADLVISKSLRASYKDPSKIAHKVLADRIGARDPGNRPVVNERIPFVYIKTDKPNALQGDRIENPEYIVENKLIPDYLHYITNQIMKPVLQLYALCLDQLPGYDKCDEYWSQVEEELLAKPLYADDTRRKSRIENLKLALVKELLFDKYINMLSEPKKKRAVKQKAPVITTKPKSSVVSVDAGDAVSTADAANAVSTANTEETKATIKITKNQQSGNIVSEANVLNGKTKVWTYKNDSKTDKDNELIAIILAMVASDTSKKYLITVNCAPFVKDYTLALAKYNEMVKNKDINVVENAFKDLDAGKIKDIGKIKKYWSLLEISGKFRFESKTKR